MLKSPNNSQRSKRSLKPYLSLSAVALAIGLAPAALNYSVDPYEYFQQDRLSKREADSVEKTHYAMWKFARYDGKADTVILGDSRARSLRDKYWHEFGAKGAFNFAYGGGTIPEVYSTFQAIKNNPNLKTLIIGVQLRSFDETHKGGMNRVPEAVKATASPTSYLKNWFVARQSWRLLSQSSPALAQLTETVSSAFSVAAWAVDLGAPGTTPFKTLMRPDVCYGCNLPTDGVKVDPVMTKGPNLGLGRGRHRNLMQDVSAFPERVLPAKFNRQVEKNARSDWQNFNFSKRYFEMMEKIGQWAKAKPERRVIFVIPPTIDEMRQTISSYGLSSLDRALRQRLATLGTVVDFDFQSQMTRQVSNFSDAYHFNSKVARQIVGEILLVKSVKDEIKKRIFKRRSLFECPSQKMSKGLKAPDFEEGRSCRIWKGAGNV